MNLVGRTVGNRYKITKKIGEGGMSTVWAAHDISSNSNVAIKVLKKDVTSQRIEDIIRFRNEATIVSRLTDPGIVKVYEVGEFEGRHYIVMEYMAGKSLHDILSDGKSFSIIESIEIIYRVCSALKVVHNANVVHRDLKPGNIIINSVEQNLKKHFEVKLIDFGLSQIRELSMKETDGIFGTLYYISPEQSGLVKKRVDERSDLYSLGVIFYQLLANHLPFIGDSINAIIHQHIAKVPEKLTKLNKNVTPALEKIIFKLLEKEPENRYQSIEGLLYDLEKVKNGQIDFEPGLNDHTVKLSFRTDLVGREEELQIIKSGFDKAMREKGGIYFISGEAGKGKTRLVEEFRNYVVDKEGIFIDGKCFSGENKVPYGPVKDAINAFIKGYLKYPKDVKSDIRQKMKENMGDLGEIILKINPAMEEILGKCPPLIKLESDRENQRFQMVANQFFYILGKTHKAVVLMLDDLQWTDEASMELLSGLIREIDGYKVMVVGTYRSDEVKEEHTLKKFITKAMSDKCPLTQIQLKSFNLHKMNRFISTMLFDSEENVGNISKFILHKSNGNPLFSIEILKQLVNEKVLYHTTEGWKLDAKALEKIQIPSTIIDTILKRISELSENEVFILSHAAVIGNKFDIEYLFRLIEMEREVVIEVIDKALKIQVLEQDFYERGRVIFVHDRIKEAFYKCMDEDIRRQLHLKIAKLLEKIHRDDLNKAVFDLAYHYVQCDDVDKALEYVYPAGIKSKESNAYEDAAEYFLLVIHFLEAKGEKDSLKWIECMEHIGEIYSLIGKVDEAMEFFNRLILLVKEEIKIANIYKMVSHTYLRKGDTKNAIKYATKGLSLLGERVPDNKCSTLAGIIRELIVFGMHRLFKPMLYNETRDKRKRDKYILAGNLFFVLNWSFVLTDNSKIVYGVLRNHNKTESHVGDSSNLRISNTHISMIIGSAGLVKSALKFFEKMEKAFAESDDIWGTASLYQSKGFCLSWNGDYEQSIVAFKKSVEIFRRIGDIKEFLMSLNGLIYTYACISDYKSMKTLIDLFDEYSGKSKDQFGVTTLKSVYSIYYTEIGTLEKAKNCLVESYGIACDTKDWFSCCTICILLGSAFIEAGDSKTALEYLEKAKNLVESNNFIKQFTINVYPILADGYIHEYMTNMHEITNRKVYLKKIGKACSLALQKTKGWVTHYGYALRVTAKYYALKGEYGKAQKMFLKSIEHTTRYKRKYEIAKGLYEYGILLKQLGNEGEARNNLENAYHMFREMESRFYEKKIAEILGINQEIHDSTERFSKEIRYTQRMSSILSLTQDISSILDLDILLEKTMMIAIEVSGAQNGYLMMKDEKTGKLSMIARKNLNEDDKSVSQSIIEEVFEKGEAVITINAAEDDKYKNYESVAVNDLKSVLCIPIRYKDEMKGVCYLDNKLSSSVFAEEDIDILKSILTQAAISIENAKLYKMAITDGLTELITHKHFKYMLEKEIERSLRYQKIFSLLMFDIDYFKKVNDTYGHPAGDEVLISVSRTARECFRNADVIARYGGEEFAVILPETDESGANMSAERFRETVKNLEVIYEDKKIKVSISIGIASFPAHADSMSLIIKCADSALYRSKEGGRDRVTVYE